MGKQNSKYSVSRRVVEHLKAGIANANWRVGDKIPSKNSLTRELGVSRASVRMAIQQFIALGIDLASVRKAVEPVVAEFTKTLDPEIIRIVEEAKK